MHNSNLSSYLKLWILELELSTPTSAVSSTIQTCIELCLINSTHGVRTTTYWQKSRFLQVLTMSLSTLISQPIARCTLWTLHCSVNTYAINENKFSPHFIYICGNVTRRFKRSYSWHKTFWTAVCVYEFVPLSFWFFLITKPQQRGYICCMSVKSRRKRHICIWKYEIQNKNVHLIWFFQQLRTYFFLNFPKEGVTKNTVCELCVCQY